jgi:hypothetical protein
MIIVYVLAVIGGACVVCFLACLFGYLVLDYTAERDWRKSKDEKDINDAIQKGDDTEVF